MKLEWIGVSIVLGGIIWVALLGGWAASAGCADPRLPPASNVLAAQIVPAWGATQPVTILFTSTQTIRWELTPYSAVITLPKDIISAGSFRPSAIFTFTPKSGYVFSAPLTSLEHFFDLDADYVLTGNQIIPAELEAQDVAFNLQALPQFEWQYQDADLLGVQEGSVRLYVYWKLIGLEGWEARPGTVYPESNRAVFQMNRIGVYGLAGYRGLAYLPIILNNK